MMEPGLNPAHPGPGAHAYFSIARRNKFIGTSTIQAEGIIKVPKTSLQEPRQKLRRRSEGTIERTARCVPMAIRFPDLLVHLEQSQPTGTQIKETAPEFGLGPGPDSQLRRPF